IDQPRKGVYWERLHQESIGVKLIEPTLQGVNGGQDDYGWCCTCRAQPAAVPCPTRTLRELAQQIPAGTIREVDIEQDHVERATRHCQHLLGSGNAVRLSDAVPTASERQRDDAPKRIVVLDEEYLSHANATFSLLYLNA